MWVPMTEWTILMLHGVARLPATAAALETASRFRRRKDFPGASWACPNSPLAQQPHPSNPRAAGQLANGPCLLRPSYRQT